MASAKSASGLPCRSSSSWPRCSCVRSRILPRRKWSIARCFAVAMSQAPGLTGTPDSGHCSKAATSASCARSSAIPISPTMRARPAMSLADSIRQTASIASAALCRLIHHLPDLDLQVLIPEPDVGLEKATRPLERFLFRRYVVDREAAEYLFRFGERAIRDGDFPVREPGARAQRRRRQPAHPDHFPLPRCFLPELHDPLDELGRRPRAGFARLHNGHESHGHLPERCLFFAIAARWRSSCSRNSGVNSTPKSSVSKNCRISTSPSWNGIRFAHSNASALFFTCQIQKPAISSFASV